MWLPTQAQVAAAARNIGSFAGGAVTIFGLSKAVDPEQLKATINAIGDAASASVTALGMITTLLAAYYASKSASPANQLKAVAANPEVQRVVVTSQAVADAAPAKVVTPLDIVKGDAPPILNANDPRL